MNPPQNLPRSRCNWRATVSVCSALLSVAFSVTPLSAARGEDVTLSAPLDHYLVTNLTFSSATDYAIYTNNVLHTVDVTSNAVEHALVSWSAYQTDIALASSKLTTAYTRTDDAAAKALILQAQDLINRSHGHGHDLEVMQQKVAAVDTMVRSGAYVQSLDITVTTSGSGGGGCMCPDYTAILQSIASNCVSIAFDLHQIHDFWGYIENIWAFLFDDEEWVTSVGTGWFAFSQGIATIDPSGDGMEGISRLSMNTYWQLSNAVARAKAWDALARTSPWSAMVSSSDPVVDALAESFNAVRQLFSDEWDSHYLRNDFVEQFRDFYAFRAVAVTNWPDAPELADLQVSVTNRLAFDPVEFAALWSNLYLSIAYPTQAIHVVVDNTNGPYSVIVLNTNDFHFTQDVHGFQQSVSGNIDVLVNVAQDVSDETGGVASYDSIDETLSSYHEHFDKQTEVKRVWDKWGDLWHSISVEPPQKIRIVDGYSPNNGNDSNADDPWGGVWRQIIDIQSLEWTVDYEYINPIRKIFQALWGLVLLVVVCAAFKLNFLIARCLISVFYALLAALGGSARGGMDWGVAFDRIMRALSDLYTGLMGGNSAE